MSPLHIDTAIGFVHKVGDVRTADSVYRHALAPRHIAHNRLAFDGITTTRAIHHQIAMTFDGDGVAVAPEYPSHHVAECVRLGGNAFCCRLGARRHHPREHTARRILT